MREIVREGRPVKILNYGSLNIDHVYQVGAFVQAGETISASAYQTHTGGKGLNQSIALARAGAEVYHGGKIGRDGLALKHFLEQNGVDCRFLTVDEQVATGHAIVQVAPSGENCIIIYGGANAAITHDEIDRALAHFTAGDYLLLQNEISNTEYLITQGHARGMKVILNPSPITEELLRCPVLHALDWVILNETEAAAFSGETERQACIRKLKTIFPSAGIVLTAGCAGAVCFADGEECFVPAASYGGAVDTTGAGDTFTGYFFAGIGAGGNIKESMLLAAKASALAVTRKGAAEAIPRRNEL